MSDPRELGLPPLDGAPAFSSTPGALSGVRRRHTRRRQRRMTAAGGGLAAAAIAVAFALNSGATNGALEQQQPAHSGPGSSSGPSANPQGSPTAPAPAVRGSAPAAPRPAANPLPATSSGPGNTGAQSSPQPNRPTSADSTPVRRDRTTLGNEICREPLSGWGTTGWCFVAAEVNQLTAGKTVTLSVALCRNGTDAAQVRFPTQQQAAWDAAQGHTHFWKSNEQPSPFVAGEVVTLQPKECLRWRVDWRVTTHGRPMPTGDYLIHWNTGADLRDPGGYGYHDSSNTHVGPGSSSSGIGPVPHALPLVRLRSAARSTR